MLKQSYTYKMWLCKLCFEKLILCLGKVAYIGYDSFTPGKNTKLISKNFKFSLIHFCMFDLLVVQVPDGL